MEESRPATLDDLKLLVKALDEQGAPYLLIGGYALFAHGYSRTTIDIDILVPRSREAGMRVVRALTALPDKAAREINPEWFDEGETIRVADEIVVDVMFKACGETFESLSPFAETVEIDGVPVRTVNLEGLLLTKKGIREKDAADRMVLEKAVEVLRKQERK